MPWGVRLNLTAQGQLFGLRMRQPEVVSLTCFGLLRILSGLVCAPSEEAPLGQQYHFRARFCRGSHQLHGHVSL